MSRYVILLHELPPTADRATHWDFMLEDGDALLTWALDRPLQMGEDVSAEQLEDHRRHYLDYEGPVSDDRGSVSRQDEGRFEWLQRSDQLISVALSGGRLSGVATFTLEKQQGEQTAQRWSVSLRKS